MSENISLVNFCVLFHSDPSTNELLGRGLESDELERSKALETLGEVLQKFIFSLSLSEEKDGENNNLVTLTNGTNKTQLARKSFSTTLQKKVSVTPDFTSFWDHLRQFCVEKLLYSLQKVQNEGENERLSQGQSGRDSKRTENSENCKNLATCSDKGLKESLWAYLFWSVYPLDKVNLGEKDKVAKLMSVRTRQVPFSSETGHCPSKAACVLSHQEIIGTFKPKFDQFKMLSIYNSKDSQPDEEKAPGSQLSTGPKLPSIQQTNSKETSTSGPHNVPFLNIPQLNSIGSFIKSLVPTNLQGLNISNLSNAAATQQRLNSQQMESFDNQDQNIQNLKNAQNVGMPPTNNNEYLNNYLLAQLYLQQRQQQQMQSQGQNFSMNNGDFNSMGSRSENSNGLKLKSEVTEPRMTTPNTIGSNNPTGIFSGLKNFFTCPEDLLKNKISDHVKQREAERLLANTNFNHAQINDLHNKLNLNLNLNLNQITPFLTEAQLYALSMQNQAQAFTNGYAMNNLNNHQGNVKLLDPLKRFTNIIFSDSSLQNEAKSRPKKVKRHTPNYSHIKNGEKTNSICSSIDENSYDEQDDDNPSKVKRPKLEFKEEDQDDSSNNVTGATNHLRWTVDEESFLVGLTIDCYLNHAFYDWDMISNTYEDCWRIYSHANGLKVKGRRSKPSLARHFKCIKQKIRNGGKTHSLRTFFEQWREIKLKYNLGDI